MAATADDACGTLRWDWGEAGAVPHHHALKEALTAQDQTHLIRTLTLNWTQRLSMDPFHCLTLIQDTAARCRQGARKLTRGLRGVRAVAIGNAESQTCLRAE